MSSSVWLEAETNNYWPAGLSPEERNPLPLLAAWDLYPHPQTELPNVESASLPSAKVEDVESNQSQLPFFSIQTALLRANLRKSYNQTALLRTNLRKFYYTQQLS